MDTKRTFNKESTTDDVLKSINLTSKTAIVTGATSGIGFETARALSAHGANVTVVARTEEKGASTAQDLERLTSNCIKHGVCELDKFDTVTSFAKKWLATHESLDILVNNAGIMTTPFGLTQEGFELQFATNHLGHFLLTNLLLSALLKSKASRVITVASSGHHVAEVDFDDIHFTKKEYSPVIAYGQSKTANIWFAYELNKRFSNKGLSSFSLHPGGIQTNLGRHLNEEVLNELLDWVKKLGGGSAGDGKTVEQGAATSCWAATAPELDEKGGQYLLDCNVTQEGNSIKTHASYAYDDAKAARLWDISNELLGTNFT